MCTIANATIVEEVVDELITQNKMFTAWDVTQEAKQRGADEPHRFLKGAVHGLFANGVLSNNGYSRSIIQVGSPPPWVYHPVNADPQDYEDEILNGQGNSSPTDGVQTTATATHPATAVNVVQRDVDNDGRLCVPKPMLVDLSLNDGDKVDIFTNHGDISVYAHDNDADQPDATMTVNADGRIRLGKSLLGRGGSFKITLNPTEGKISIA